ncbi:MAG: ROK family protein [Verrucomicrobiota bacterium]
MSDSGQYFAGLDVGGTTIKAILVDGAGEQVGDYVEVRSHASEGYRRTFEQLQEGLKLLCEQGGITEESVGGIGLDVPAPCSKGVIWGKANLSADWVGVNIRDEFGEEVGKKVWMTNDGNAAALGEYLLRADRLDSGLLFVAPGTGLGGGLVLPGGGLYEGARGLAMEVGDMSLPFLEEGRLPVDGRGREGCLEAWVSLIAIRRQLQIALSADEYQEHPLNEGDAPIEEKAFQLRDYAEKGDALATEIFQDQAFKLGHALGDLASLLDPGLIVIGGGLAETGFRDWYMEAVKKGFQSRAMDSFQKSPLPPHEETTLFEWAIGGDGAAAFGMARKAQEVFGK